MKRDKYEIRLLTDPKKLIAVGVGFTEYGAMENAKLIRKYRIYSITKSPGELYQLWVEKK